MCARNQAPLRSPALDQTFSNLDFPASSMACTRLERAHVQDLNYMDLKLDEFVLRELN
jgi:hypothetical protein